MTFSVKKYLADKKLEPFVFEDINGEPCELPNIMLFTSDQVNKLMAGIDTDPVAALVEVAPDMVEVLKSIPVAAVHPLAEAYLDHCKQSMGEASASPDSSTSTARPSKRTSPASTKARTRKR